MDMNSAMGWEPIDLNPSIESMFTTWLSIENMTNLSDDAAAEFAGFQVQLEKEALCRPVTDLADLWRLIGITIGAQRLDEKRVEALARRGRKQLGIY
jgi:hypothetical protein